MRKKENLINIVALIVGAIIVIFGGVVCGMKLNYSGTQETTAVITHMDVYYDVENNRRYRTRVKYTVDGEEFENFLNAHSYDYAVGKEIKIYYHIDNPSEIGVKTVDYLFIPIICFGLVFMAVGGIPLILRIKKKKLKSFLREKGKKIDARYVKTIIKKGYSVNGVSPYIIICEWTDFTTQEFFVFKSEYVWDDPREFIAKENIMTFPVYLDPNKPKKYIVDVDVLPKYTQ